MMQKVVFILDAIPPPVHLQSRRSSSHTLAPTCSLARRCRSRLNCRSQVKEHNFIQGSSLEIGPTRRLSTPCHHKHEKPVLSSQSWLTPSLQLQSIICYVLNSDSMPFTCLLVNHNSKTTAVSALRYPATQILMTFWMLRACETSSPRGT